MITVRVKDHKYFKVKIIPGPLFEEDKERISELPVREAVWEDDGKTGEPGFRYHLVPRVDLAEILRKWPKNEIVFSDHAQDIYDKYRESKIGLLDMPAETKRIDTFGFKLTSDQHTFAHINIAKKRLLNLSETGEGKTIATFARWQVTGFNRCLIATVKNSLPEWKSEIKHYFGSSDSIIYAGSANQRRRMLDECSRRKFIITTSNFAHELLNHLEGVDQLVIDEVDVHSQTENQFKKSMKLLQPVLDWSWLEKSVRFTGLTATLMGNTVFSIWNSMRMCDPMLAGTRESFLRRYEKIEYENAVVPIRQTGGGYKICSIKKVVSRQPQNVRELKKRLAAVAYTPSKSREERTFESHLETRHVQMGKAQRELYNELKDEGVALLDERRIGAADAKSKLIRIRQVSEGIYNLWEREKLIEVLSLPRKEFLATDFGSAKLDYVIAKLKKRIAKKKKAIVWSCFVPGLYILLRVFHKYGVIFSGELCDEEKKLNKWAFAGVKTEDDREEYARLKEKYHGRFEPGEALFFFTITHPMSARAMNLQACNCQYLLSHSAGHITYGQTIGRIIRRGQKAASTFTIHINNEDSVDDDWQAYMLNKRKSAKMIVNGKDAMDKDEAIALLRMLRKDYEDDE